MFVIADVVKTNYVCYIVLFWNIIMKVEQTKMWNRIKTVDRATHF